MKSKKYIKKKRHNKTNKKIINSKRINRKIKSKKTRKFKKNTIKQIGGAAIMGALNPGGAAGIMSALKPGGGVSDMGSALDSVTKGKGPGFIQSELIKGKSMSIKTPLPSMKDLPNPTDRLKQMTSSAQDGFKKLKSAGASLKKMIPTSGKDFGKGAKLLSNSPLVPWRFTKAVLRSMRNIATATLLLPTLTMNQVVPPTLCKYYLKNDRICSQTVSEYLLKGSTPDFSKRDVTKNDDECITFNPETNKYEQCKPDKMKGGGGKKKGLIITCKTKIDHGLYKDDRVMVYIILPEGEPAIEANKLSENVYIGKIVSIDDKSLDDHGKPIAMFSIKLENCQEGPMKVQYNDKDPNIMKYDKNFKTFLNEFNKYFEDMYKNNIKWSENSNKKLDIFLLYSIYIIIGAVAIPTLISLAIALEISLKGIIIAGVTTGVVLSGPPLLIYLCYRIYIKISENKSIKRVYLETIKRLIDSEKVTSEKKNLYILQQLVKINHHLRLYECPRDVLESTFELIRDVKLLKKIKHIINEFLKDEPKEEKEYHPDQKKCDVDYDELTKSEPKMKTPGEGLTRTSLSKLATPVNTKLLTKFELKPNIQYVHAKNHLFNFFMPSRIEPTEKEACEKINRLDPLTIMDSVGKTIKGNKDHIAHIVINVFKGISNSDGDIYDNTKEILKNIQCRSNIIGVIDERIETLNRIKEERLAKVNIIKEERLRQLEEELKEIKSSK